jgi:CpeT/CpcT family (DUF1001)
LPFPTWTDEFLSLFQGDFDNYRQVVEDRDNGLLPREGGGHEHMHSRLLPIRVAAGSDGGDRHHDYYYSRLAAFYLDGVPTNIFRFRYYQLTCRVPEALDLQIYFLNPALEHRLRQFPVEDWNATFASAAAAAATSTGESSSTAAAAHITYVPSCDIRWRRSTTSSITSHDQNSTAGGGQIGPVFHATMLAGDAGIVVPSQVNPQQLIHIQDEIWVTAQQLIIHDRGRDPVSQAWIYGNQRGVPYRLDRVIMANGKNNNNNNMVQNADADGDGEYDVDEDSLQWTNIGPSSPLYAAKMARIGGASAPARPRPPSPPS